MNHTAVARIDLQALAANLAATKALVPGKKILAMVKANAYGHGLINVAQALKAADALGVATISEALRLREAGIAMPIVVMRGFSTADELAYFLKDAALYACIHDPNQLSILTKYPFSEADVLRIWLKIDTGMHRLGFLSSDFQNAYAQLMQLPVIQKPFVICSHLADADNVDTTFTQKQISQFENLTKNIKAKKSLLNSAGILTQPQAAYDWVRPGLMLYGISPLQNNHAKNDLMKNFQPVMTLKSRLIALKTILPGEKIGYGCIYTAKSEMKIGIIGMGYGDSYPRQVKVGTPVLIQGKRCPIVGCVSMDMIAVDVSALENIAVDDEVILWGNDLCVSEIAAFANTISYELLCHLTGRVVLQIL